LQPAQILLIASCVILLSLTISCILVVDSSEDHTTASTEEQKEPPRKPAVTIEEKETTTYTLIGPCERVFLEHPKQKLTVTKGSGTFYSPPDEASGTPVQSGFKTTVEQNVGYKFVVEQGNSLTFTAETTS